MQGQECGVAWKLEDGMLEIRLGPNDAWPLCQELRRLMREHMCGETPSPFDFEQVHRASRMAWEAARRGTMSSLDRHDCDLLYRVRQLTDVEWVFRILNRVRQHVRRADTEPDMADRWAKDVAGVMTY